MKSNSLDTVQQIKSRLNIVDLISRYVSLKQKGNRWFALCPFHQEGSPSFSVNPEEGFFYCFGCQAAGDIFDFYGRINGLDFKETLTQLADEAGVSLVEYTGKSKGEKRQVDTKKNAFAMYEHASQYFIRNLQGSQGKECREYLHKRKISEEIIQSFELGWSLPAWQGLAESLKKSGFSEQEAETVGLVAKSDQGRYYDRFRGRLIFPIKNLSGKVIAFGGRIIGTEDGAKYINSSDSPIYKKGDNVYGLFQARRSIAAQGSILLTEGYMDVLSLHQFSYTNSCGVLGTALTEEQVKRLSGFTSSFELLFDGDKPGRKAALRACEMILTKGLRCKVVLLPTGEDVDSLLQNNPPEVFEELRGFAPDGLDFCIRVLLSEFSPKESLEWTKRFLSQVEYSEILPQFISRLCRGLDFDEKAIRSFLKDKTGTLASEEKLKREIIQTNLIKPEQEASALDQELIKFIVRYPHHAATLEKAGIALVFSSQWAHNFWEKILSAAPHFSSDHIVSILDQEEKEFWVRYRLAEAPPNDTEMGELEDVLQLIERLCIEKQKNACLQALRQNANKDEYDLSLLQALNETLVQKRARGRSNE